MSAFASIGDSTAHTEFKRVADGAWVFRAPVPWMFGRRPHYFVTSNQKSEIEKIFGRSFLVWSILVVASIVLVNGRGSQLVQHALPPSILGLPSLFLVTLALALVLRWLQNAYHCLALSKLLGGAAPTPDRITFHDRLRIRAARQSRQSIKHGIAACVILIALALLEAVLTRADLAFTLWAIA